MDGPAAPPPRPQVIVREVHRISISSFWIVALLGVAAAGYFVATDWAEKHHKALHTFSDYTDAISAVWDDAEYKKDLAGRVQDFLQLPSCSVPLKWAATGYVGPCYLTLYQPVRLYPGADIGIFITAPVGSVIKVAEPSPTNGDYAYAQTLKLNGVASPTGATTADACIADHRCSAPVSGLNTAGYKPATEAIADAPSTVSTRTSSLYETYRCPTGDADNQNEQLLTVDTERKKVRLLLRHGPFSCDLTFVDGAVAALTSADDCNVPGLNDRLPLRQWVEFASDVVSYGAAKPDADGNVTAEQRKRTNRLLTKTGLLEQTNGTQLQCRALSAK